MLREETVRFSGNQLRKQTTLPISNEKVIDREDTKPIDSDHHQRKGIPRHFRRRLLCLSGSSLFWIWLSQPQRLFIRSQILRRMRRQKRSCVTTTRPRHSPIRQYYDLLRKRRRLNRWYTMHPMHHRRKERVILKKTLLPTPPDIPSHDDSVATTEHRKSKSWMPPINSATLQELSISSIFKSIQLRHDLLFDAGLSFRPNLDGSSGREKCKRAQRYWRRVDRALLTKEAGDCLCMIFSELHKILLSLFSPFASTPARYEPWHWPSHISLDYFCLVFDVDFIMHQIKHGTFSLHPFATILIDILTPLCPDSELAHLDLLNRYLKEEQFSKAMCQCFSILEAIKLDCANKVLHRYRSYLINTCAEVELRCFKKQWENNEIRLDSTYHWLRYHWQKQNGKHATFLDIYYEGLLQFISKDAGTLMDDNRQLIAFPITLQFDEKRLTVQLRQEFQSLLMVSIVLIPYRYLAGSFATKSDIIRLKRTCIDLFKDYVSMVDGAPLGNPPLEEDTMFRLCYRLANKACYRAFQTHHRHHVETTKALIGPDQLCQVSHFWTQWLVVHLHANSPIYMLAYDRMCQVLRFISQHGASAVASNTIMTDCLNRMVGIQDNIMVLGEKVKLLADLNLETFGSVYKTLAIDLLYHQ
ncbi:T-complex protein 11-domain-containing protein [Chlamydoabsidia padenii]|nr:T-complex protein 11-domain-containing protein [Chlamydoabsidia padenii]